MWCKWTIAVISLAAFIRGDANTTESQLFGFLEDLNDWNNVLFICDFFRSHKYSCNVTVNGVNAINNTSISREVLSAENGTTKFALHNVRGKWNDNDGLLKGNRNALESGLVARCVFNKDYFECFGIPTCDVGEPAGPCFGGEPWRGEYEGDPTTGFKGRITAEAMASPVQTDAQDEKQMQPIISESTDQSGKKTLSAVFLSPTNTSTINLTITASKENGTSIRNITSFISVTGNSSSAFVIPGAGEIQLFQVDQPNTVVMPNLTSESESATSTPITTATTSARAVENEVKILAIEPKAIEVVPATKNETEAQSLKPIIEQSQDEDGNNLVSAFVTSPKNDTQVNITVFSSSRGDQHTRASSGSFFTTNQNLASDLFAFPMNLFSAILPSSLLTNPTDLFPTPVETPFLPLGTGRQKQSQATTINAVKNRNTSSERLAFPSSKLPPFIGSEESKVNSTAANVTSSCENMERADFHTQVRCKIFSVQRSILDSLWSGFSQIGLDLPAPPSASRPKKPRFNGFKLVMTPIFDPLPLDDDPE